MRQFVKALSQHYIFDADNCVLIFDDGIRYTTDEAIIISKGVPRNADLRAIHQIKKIFDGEVVGIGDESPFSGWIVPRTEPPVPRAASSSVVPVLAGKLSSRKNRSGGSHKGSPPPEGRDERGGSLQMRLTFTKRKIQRRKRL